MKKASVLSLILSLCLLAVSCAKTSVGESSAKTGESNANKSEEAKSEESASTIADSLTPTPAPTGEPVTFNFVPSKGLKSSYETRMTLRVNVDTPPSNIVASMGGNLDTEVTASNADGSWTVQNRIGQMRIEATMNGNPLPVPPQTQGIAGKSFAVTYDKTGKIIRTTGIGSSQAEQSVAQIMEQINPTEMFPKRPVRVGESWPVNFEMAIPSQPGTPSMTIKAKGTGKLVEVVGSQAALDYDLALDLLGGPFSASGAGKSTLKYDMEKARLVSNRMDMTFNLSGQAPSAPGQQMKATMNLNANIDLVNR
ncbi:MAG TPA: hypothetical protein VNN73_13865 [Blastocatellia bacterium]|nr:hypothetical protein [Blastocatellia bacterium]